MVSWVANISIVIYSTKYIVSNGYFSFLFIRKFVIPFNLDGYKSILVLYRFSFFILLVLNVLLIRCLSIQSVLEWTLP